MTEARGQMSRLSPLSNSATGSAFVVLLVLFPPYKILIYEDEYENNQIRSHAYVPASAG